MNHSEYINGERIQQMADMYLGTAGDFMYNPVIFEQIDKHQIIDDIDAPFDNPPTLFSLCSFDRTIFQKVAAPYESIYVDYPQF
jgi:hypothetical protein